MKSKLFGLSLICILAFPMMAFGQLTWPTGITMTPGQPKSGDTITFQAFLKADDKNEAGFKVVAGVDNKQLFNRAYKEMISGKGRYIRFRWKALTGNHSVYFKVIPRGTAAPQKATTMVKKGTAKKTAKNPLFVSKRFSVGVQQVSTIIKPKKVKAAERKQPVCEGRPLPDIAPYDMSIHGVAKPGATIRLNAIFENRGQCDTGFFSIRMEVYVQIPDENLYEVYEIGKKLVGSLKPCREKSCNGSRHMTTFEYTLLNKDYVYYEFSAFGDSTWDVEEFNEKNNVWKRKTTLTVRRQ